MREKKRFYVDIRKLEEKIKHNCLKPLTSLLPPPTRFTTDTYHGKQWTRNNYKKRNKQ